MIIIILMVAVMMIMMIIAIVVIIICKLAHEYNDHCHKSNILCIVIKIITDTLQSFLYFKFI